MGEGGCADTGRAVEEEGGDAVGLDGAAEEHAWGDEVLLAGVFVEAAGADAGGEGGVLGGDLGGRWRGRGGVEEVGHGDDLG